MTRSLLFAAGALVIGSCDNVAQNPPAKEPVREPTGAPAGEPSAEAKARVAPSPAAPPAATRKASPCLIQDGEPLDARRLRAIGTEPFWGARIEGRCVTYSTPDDQAGTRVWTRFTGTAASGSWTGALGGKRFELRTRAEPGCSDGMSDNVYPIAVELLVAGEQRRGCAEPVATGR